MAAVLDRGDVAGGVDALDGCGLDQRQLARQDGGATVSN